MVFPIMELAVTFVTSWNPFNTIAATSANSSRRCCQFGQCQHRRFAKSALPDWPATSVGRICSRNQTLFVIERTQFRDEKQSAADFTKRYLFSLDVLPKGFRILRVSRFLHSATLECADCFNHGEGDEARFKEILDEASATVLYDRILMLLFAIHGKRTKRIQRTNLGYCG